MSRSKIIPVKLDDGTVFNVEASITDDDEEEISLTDAVFNFSDITSKITGISKSLMDSIKQADLDKISVKMGFEIGLESGGLTALIAKGSGNTNIEVTMEWAKK